MPHVHPERFLSVSPKALQVAGSILGASVLALLTVGFVTLASTSSASLAHAASGRFAERQALWLALGLAACAAASCVDYHRYRNLAWPIYAAALVVLIGVLLCGKRVNGAARWFVCGPLQFQPSEFVKYACVLFLAAWLEKMQRPQKGKAQPRLEHWWWGVTAPLALTCVLAALVVREPDLGTGLLLIGVAMAMMWMAGAHRGCWWTICLVGLLGIVLCLVAIFKYGMFHDHYQAQRVIHWWRQDDPMGINRQQRVAVMALGSGGLWGLGLGNSRMKFGFLSEAHTDFILPVFGEELGLAATLAVLLAFLLIVLCGIVIANRSTDLFGMLLSSGIVLMIALQAIINIAVVTNILPNKGMPLPFVSYGGSGLVMVLLAVGVLMNISFQGYRHDPGLLQRSSL